MMMWINALLRRCRRARPPDREQVEWAPDGGGEWAALPASPAGLFVQHLGCYRLERELRGGRQIEREYDREYAGEYAGGYERDYAREYEREYARECAEHDGECAADEGEEDAEMGSADEDEFWVRGANSAPKVEVQAPTQRAKKPKAERATLQKKKPEKARPAARADCS